MPGYRQDPQVENEQRRLDPVRLIFTAIAASEKKHCFENMCRVQSRIQGALFLDRTSEIAEGKKEKSKDYGGQVASTACLGKVS
jgi:hypothetical protein